MLLESLCPASGNRGESEGGGGFDIDDLSARDYVPDFKTIRSGSSSRGLSSGDSGEILYDPNITEEEANRFLCVDWTEDYTNMRINSTFRIALYLVQVKCMVYLSSLSNLDSLNGRSRI